MRKLIVAGGGLAGSEAAWQAASRGVKVLLCEMRPEKTTGAHATSHLGELVCSNSLGSVMADRASGLLKQELRIMDSLLLRCADDNAVPAGSALAVDRDAFALQISARLTEHPNIEVVRREITEIPDEPVIIATGPLTSKPLSRSLADLAGEEHLYFFDAISPIVAAESINMDIAFRASRYDKGTTTGDYINCPLDDGEYQAFVEALLEAERIELKSFEKELERGVRAGAHKYFEGCLPVEIIARRGKDALAFGPMRPVGLFDPRSDRRPHAVLQLRQDNQAGTLYNLVGFQTNLKFSEQRRVFGLIPGLEQAEFVRYGQMHRNTFIASPKLLLPSMQFRKRKDLFLAGQITGVEGYVGNIATGLLAGINAARLLKGLSPLTLPPESMIGALCHYITHASLGQFQPMKANFGIMPSLPPATELAIEPLHPALQSLSASLKGFGARKKLNKRQRGLAYAQRALSGLQRFLRNQGELSAREC